MPTKQEADVVEAGSNLPVPLGGATMGSMMEDVPSPEDIEDMAPAVSSGTKFSDVPDFDTTDVAWPRLRVAQPLTEEVGNNQAKAGDFVLSGYKPLQAVTIIPLRWAKSRIYARGTGNDRQTLCVSDDGKTGKGIPGGVCEDCEMNQWLANPANPAKNLPPLCNELQNYICYAVEYKTVVLLSLKSTAAKTAKGINSLIVGRGMGEFAIHLTTAKQQGGKGTYYVPLYTILDDEDLPEGLLAKAKNQLR